MGLLEVILSTPPAALEGASAVGSSGDLEAVWGATPLERMGGQFLAVLVVASIVLGVGHRFGKRSIERSRRSPIITLCLGLPALLVVVAVTGAGAYVIGSPLGTFAGLMAVVLGTFALSVTTALGYAAIGRSLAAQAGVDKLWVGVVAGSLLGGLAAYAVPILLAVTAVAASLGLGAGVRVLRGSGSTSSPEDRRVPPANEI